MVTYNWILSTSDWSANIPALETKNLIGIRGSPDSFPVFFFFGKSGSETSVPNYSDKAVIISDVTLTSLPVL